MSCMKHWKSGFFLIDRRAIPDYMSWRHLSSAIDDPKPPVGSYNIEDVCRLSAHVLKLRDMPEGILILSRLSRVWKSQTFDALWAFTISCVFLSGPGLRLRKNLIMILGPLCRGFPSTVPPMLLLIPPCCYLAASTPSAKVMAKAESSKKQKALLFGVALSHSGGSAPSTAKGPSIRDSRGKDVMIDASATPSRAVGHSRPVAGHASSFKDVSISAMLFIGTFSPFLLALTIPLHPEGGIAGNCEISREEWNALHHPTLTILTKVIFKDPSVCKAVVDQFPTPGKMKRVVDLNDKLSTSDVAFAKAKSKGKEQKTKKIKSLTKYLDQLNAEVACLTSALNQATILEAKRDAEILQLKASPSKFVSFFRSGLIKYVCQPQMVGNSGKDSRTLISSKELSVSFSIVMSTTDGVPAFFTADAPRVTSFRVPSDAVNKPIPEAVFVIFLLRLFSFTPLPPPLPF
ncbi:hypothetical protein Tco_0467711 [Tanacetum coccineum]